MSPSRGCRCRSAVRARSTPSAVALAGFLLIAFVGCGGGSSPSEPTPSPEGAIFRVVVGEETFHILILDSERIAEAEALLVDGAPRKTVHGRLRRGDGGFNQPWSWHLDPATAKPAEVCADNLDGLPSHVEAGLHVWIDEIKFFCPWSGELVARVR